MEKNKSSSQLSSVRAMFTAIKDRSKHPSKLKNLDLLWSVLESMRAENAQTYALSEVGRRLEAVGGPKTQSLRNQQGADFREVVECYAKVAKVEVQKIDSTQLEQAIALIPDPSVRVVLKEFFAESKKLKHENDQLRSAFKSLSIGAANEGAGASSEKTTLEVLPAPVSAISQRSIEVLRKSFNEKRMRERGLTVKENGSVIDDAGAQLFPPGFSQAISEILK